MILNSKYGDIEIYAKTVEQDAISQIYQMANSPLGENAHIRIMPDCHAGAGCVIGTTMLISDKVCPNLVGVDIGCGVDLVKTDIDFSHRFEELDSVIRKYIPFGAETHGEEKPWNFEDLYCWDYLKKEVKDKAKTSLGTLGGGNHFIEAYADGWLSVHSGSRNIGYKVAEYYQNLAEKRIADYNRELLKEKIKEIEPTLRESWLKNNKFHVNKELCFLTGEDMRSYLHDVSIMQKFANDNRLEILRKIVSSMDGSIEDHISSIHNYIDTNHMILRKGAISAQKNELLVIPLNMRDGLLLCKGKGNAEWNYSAPHGAGRLYSRSEAKRVFTVEEYQSQMKGIYSTCINQSTLDEAPFAYKDYEEIMECIEPTVDVLNRLIPIFNFKASETNPKEDNI
ncbi:MAG: RtcB family protein [Clostridia bacterium]|nr:RtcB family protein [Clostridia bacterium]